MEGNKLSSWQMTELKGEFKFSETSLPSLNENEVLVKVAGCGVCHTDISFWYSGVKSRHELPLTLGHEISGTVVAAASKAPAKVQIIAADSNRKRYFAVCAGRLRQAR